MKQGKPPTLLAVAGVVGLALAVAPACSRLERQNVDGVD